MPMFSEMMKTLTDEIACCRRERAATLTGLQEHTVQLLADSRALLKHLGEDHCCSGERLRKDLATDRQRRAEQTRTQRMANRQFLRQTRQQLSQMLGRVRGERQEKMQQMLQGFHAIQQQLATDFRTAAQLWRQHRQQRPDGN